MKKSQKSQQSGFLSIEWALGMVLAGAFITAIIMRMMGVLTNYMPQLTLAVAHDSADYAAAVANLACVKLNEQAEAINPGTLVCQPVDANTIEVGDDIAAVFPSS